MYTLKTIIQKKLELINKVIFDYFKSNTIKI